ncbi:MAG: arginyl-tRNA synthetase [Actinomycetia bacterium]|nr:arginyl-tRNA synthetase [Actinomycetes bacterium]
MLPLSETLLTILTARITEAARAAFGPDVPLPDPLVLPTRDPQHGDYSTPAAMSAAKVLGKNPFELAEQLAAALDVADVAGPPEVVRPGFVNLRLRPEWLAIQVAAAVGDDRLGLAPVAAPERVVVDYSSPNLAKEMHVGHLRSTIIGDALANVFEHLGHDVERVNHVGDWGAQFGMLLVHLEDLRAEGRDLDMNGVEAFYREANVRDKDDAEFHERARNRVVELQNGEPDARATWAELVELTERNNQVVYDLLGIEGLVLRGESFYQPMLDEVVAELDRQGLLVEDQGAKVVFVPGFTNKEGEPLPIIVQNRHGGYGYATTDLAAIRHRVGELGSDRVLYVVDIGQSQHFAMVFAVARMAGWVPTDVELSHVPFGLVLGEDGKRLRTRSGENVRLRELVLEAVDGAKAFVVARAEERGDPVPDDLDHVAATIGIGAVKYADLSQNRQSNYVFSYEKMLSLKGNTAPYLQYAYARMRSILREAGWGDGPPSSPSVKLTHDAEVELAKKLVATSDILGRMTEEYAPNHLCAHLYELSQAYNQFYEHCPVLKSDEPLRSSRLALCDATSRTLKVGLGLLGVGVLERI